ncbi:hypothetical protein H310_13614 [Aphanomyces invadans]|uniref:SET domain-containing protein n=1 Tax=Aphanomyces invadans TaxID=157072 RepID=A0A024TDB2_9STRA|nr:hypothetical protein H310_13614 [Aphanomyces invadans]ETV91974.1 hypothetical protein H310_13614 [Aphanomyces invadans]|eukprot:XP_008879398.1 hypothetical protein H310_13614 [Aphanomyces invadans]
MMSHVATFRDAPVTQDITQPIRATKAIPAGHPIFQEVALVASTFGDSMHPDCCVCDHHDEYDDCAEPQNEPPTNDDGGYTRPPVAVDDDDVETMSPHVLDSFAALMAHCDRVPVLKMVDVRKNLFKLLRLHEVNASHPSLALLHTVPIDTDDFAEYHDAAANLRASFGGIVPTTLADNDVAHLIGVLNHKYCHALNEIEGSGVFVYSSVLTHSCVPNCNLTVTGTTIWITAIQDIAPGQVLTVDAADLFYRPLNERKECLAVDKITCTCDLCELRAPDLARAFKCQACADGIVHPTGHVYACTTCRVEWSDGQIQDAVAQEDAIVETLDATTLVELDEFIATSLLHPFHYIFFWALDDLHTMCVDSNVDNVDLAKIYRRLLDCLNYTLPYPHDEKVQHYDHLAQTLVAIGDIPGATAAYEAAYAMSCLCSGNDYDESQLYWRLSTNTPTTKEALLHVYKHNGDDGDVRP